MGSFLCLAPDRAHVSPLPSLLSLVIQNPSSRSSSSNMFGDLKTPAGVEALEGAPGSDTPHAQRWYNHIKSFAAGMKQFAKASKDAAAYVAGGAAPAAAEEEDDDDCDLFGSDEDEEDSEEKQKIVAERLKAYAERKAKKPGPIAKTNVLLDVKPWDDET